MSWIEDPGVNAFEGLSLRTLPIDHAFVRIKSDLPQLWLYTLVEECYKCPFSLREDFSFNGSEPVVRSYSSKLSERWRFFADNSSDTLAVNANNRLVCEIEPALGEFGVYDLAVGSTTCTWSTAKQPVNIYLPLLIWSLVLLLLILAWLTTSLIRSYCARRAKQRFIIPTTQQLNPLDGSTPESEVAVSAVRQRLKSLDTFRGISIVLMIFVNHGAGGYQIFDHAVWNGLKMADLLFPWFMWIMGVCIPISTRSQLKKNVSRWRIFTAILRRSCILFLLGLALNTIGGRHLPRLASIRVFGVLQRFGVAYFGVATLGLLMTCRDYKTPKLKLFSALHDVIILLPQWVVISGVIAGHTVAVLLLEVPGCPKGYLGPGGRQDEGLYSSCIGGATGYLDKLILGTSHMFQHPTTSEIYGAGPFEPEGILGCLSSMVQVFLGVQAGMILLCHQSATGRVTRWITWSVITGVAGGVLCLGSKEDGWIPVNKSLWSMSFVLVTSCLAFILLSLCYLLIDVKQWWTGAPFFYAGMNPMILYVGHSVCYNLFPWHWALDLRDTHFLRLTECLWGTALWVLIAFWLFRVKFFLAL